MVIIDQQNSKGRILMSWGGGRGVTVGKFLEADAMWLAF